MDWSQLNEVTDWSDLSKIMDGAVSSEEKKETKKKDPDPKPSAEEKQEGGPSQSIQAGKKPELDPDIIDGWSDMKQFDDDHDPDWFEEEEKRLAAVYGGHFIKVKYTEQGRPGYFCELCVSEMNAKKSLEAHCEGMKHLKKKALWEKNEAEKGGRKRDDSDAQQGGWSDGPPRNFTPAGRDRSPFGRDRMRSRSPVDGGRRGRGERFRGPVRGRAPRRRGNPRDSCVLPTGPVTVFDERDGYYRDDFGPPSRRYSPPRYPENEHFRRNGPGYDAGPRRPDEEHFKRNGPGFDAEPRRPDPEYMGRNGPGYDVEPRREAHVPPRAPVERRDVPVHREQSPGVSTRIAVPTDKLSGGTAGLLLTKLASCYIKDEDDSDLALNVITSLASALREYNMKKGEKKIAELLMEAELKLNTLKALKVGLKLLNNQQTPGSSAAAAAAAVATPRPIGGETPRPTPGYSTAPSWQTERNGLAPPIDPYAGGLAHYPSQGPGPVPTRDPGPHYDPRAHAVGPAAHTPHGYQPYPSDARGTELGAQGWNHPSNYNADRNRGFPAQGTGPYAAR